MADDLKYPALVGIGGPMGSGKDTLALLLTAGGPGWQAAPDAEPASPYAGARVLHFATSLKAAARELGAPDDKAEPVRRWLPRTREGLEARVRRAIARVTGGPAAAADVEHFAAALGGLGEADTAGRLLQVLGTECFRARYGPRVFVDRELRRLDRDGPPRAVFADVRFPEEADAIRARGGVVLRLTRRAGGRDDGRSAGHASEAGGFEADAVVANDGTPAELCAAALDALARLAARA